LRKISLTRSGPAPSISGLDFIKLNHASFYADPQFMVEVLEDIYKELGSRQPDVDSGAPRILLAGPNVGYGDYQIMELVNAAGGEIVVEEICEGLRYYWHDIENTGDPIQSLAWGYLLDRVPCAFLRNSARKRLDFTLKLIEDFKVDGVIWYELLCCETYDSEAYFFTRELSERNIPILVLESDFGTAATGQLKTRIEAFLEILTEVTI